MLALMEKGLKAGSPAVGFGPDYTPGADRWEMTQMFRLAAKYKACAHIHLRGKGVKSPGSALEGLHEAIALAAVTGASVQIVHVQSTGMGSTQQVLDSIDGAVARGLDVTVECYPYDAGMTGIESCLFDPGWQEQYGIR